MGPAARDTRQRRSPTYSQVLALGHDVTPVERQGGHVEAVLPRATRAAKQKFSDEAKSEDSAAH